jgi:hypothetical protein
VCPCHGASSLFGFRFGPIEPAAERFFFFAIYLHFPLERRDNRVMVEYRANRI